MSQSTSSPGVGFPSQSGFPQAIATGLDAIRDDFRLSHLPRHPSTTPLLWWQDGASDQSLVSSGVIW